MLLQLVLVQVGQPTGALFDKLQINTSDELLVVGASGEWADFVSS